MIVLMMIGCETVFRCYAISIHAIWKKQKLRKTPKSSKGGKIKSTGMNESKEQKKKRYFRNGFRMQVVANGLRSDKKFIESKFRCCCCSFMTKTSVNLLINFYRLKNNIIDPDLYVFLCAQSMLNGLKLRQPNTPFSRIWVINSMLSRLILIQRINFKQQFNPTRSR